MTLSVPRTLMSLAVIAGATILNGGAVAAAPQAGSAWIGTWKIDTSRSHLTGDTFTFSKNKDGFFHYDDGSPIRYEFAIDGKEYPTYSDRTTTWTAVGDHAWDSVAKAKGTTLAKTHSELSADDKTLTFTTTRISPDGSTFTEHSVYTRLSGVKGLVGTWRSTQADSGPPDGYVVTEPAPGVMRWSLPSWQISVEGKLDGTNLAMTGPRATPGMTYSGTVPVPGKIAYTIKLNGEPLTVGVEKLAADGKSFTDVSYTPGKEDEKETAVYVKQ